VEGLLAGLDGSARLGAVLSAVPGPTALAAAWVLDALGAFVWSDRPQERAADSEPATRGNGAAGPVFEILVRDPASGPANARPAAAREAPASRKPPRAAEELRREIVELHASMGSRHHYELLGLAPGASLEELKRAYFAAAKRFHPDALGRLGLSELRSQAEEVFARIAEAYEVLSNEERRRDYDRGLAGEAQDTDAARIAQAEALYRKAEVLLRAGNFAGALEFLGPAVQLWPDECDYQSALGWTLYKKRPSDPKAARSHLERAVALDASDAVAHFRLGLVLRALGETKAADRERDLAQRLDPRVR
jgi:tetratricopeptide (TPR) repeat protein